MNNESNTLYIGIKYYGHDSAIFIIDPIKKKVFAMSTERMTRYKHDFLSPNKVIERYIKYTKCNPKNITKIIVGYPFKYEKMRLPTDFYSFHKNFRTHLGVSFKKDVDNSIKEFLNYSFAKKLVFLSSSISGIRLMINIGFNKIKGGQRYQSIEDHIKKMLAKYFSRASISVKFFDHETSHAICSHYTSPFPKELLFTLDGFGDGDFSKVFMADEGEIIQIAESKFQKISVNSPKHSQPLIGSVGIVYSYMTELLGFIPNADEGKVEALAAYGKPIISFQNELVSLFSINDNNGLTVDAEKMTNILNYDRIMDIIKRNDKKNVAASVQKFLEITTEKYLRHLQKIFPFDAISISGGVAANVINNLMIFENITKNIHVTPAMADDGSAQGAAIKTLIDAGYSYKDLYWLRSMIMPYYGTSYERNYVNKVLDTYSNEISFRDLGSSWPEHVAALICEGKIGAIFHGKMEWGPRALGNRSLIAIATNIEFRDKINREIKRRPYFQPFCPSIMVEERDRLFDKSFNNKHMTCAFRMKSEFTSLLPSAIHVDGTARVQFVEDKDNPEYYRILKKVKALTGFGVIINTSFNKHGRTIVESPQDAIRDFIDTDMDFLVIEGFLVKRKR
jgi:carbamoyltransferase